MPCFNRDREHYREATLDHTSEEIPGNGLRSQIPTLRRRLNKLRKVSEQDIEIPENSLQRHRK